MRNLLSETASDSPPTSTADPPSSSVELSLDRALALADLAAKADGLAQSIELYRDIIRVWPGHAEALHSLGLVLYRGGDLAGAIEQIGAAAAADPTVALYFCNLCELNRQAGRHDEALSAGRNAVRLSPDLPQALNNLGIVHFDRGEFEEAVALYERATASASGYAEAFSNLGNALRALKRHEEALAAYERALTLRPDFIDGLNNYGTTLRDLGRGPEAEAAYRRALALQPGNISVLNNLALALKERESFVEAAGCLAQVLALDRDNLKALTYFALVRLEQNQSGDARVAASRAVALAPEDAEALNALGLVLSHAEETDEALGLFERAVALKPDLADAHNNIANILKERGRTVEACAAYERAIAADPRETAYMLNLADAKTFVAGDAHLAAMEARAADMAGMGETARCRLHFALGKAYDDLRRPDEAFAHLAQGAALKHRVQAYDEAAEHGLFDRIRSAFGPAAFAKRPMGYRSSLPVFIVGMPRSGTTLIEQILASHPAVHGAGELNDFGELVNSLPPQAGQPVFRYPEDAASLSADQIRALGEAYVDRQRKRGGGAERGTDKMPANFLYLGLITLALPQARLIHVMRDPRDTCLSCYSKLFTQEQAFSYDLGELGRYYRKYVELMAHWRRVLPKGALLEVRYEDVVADIETQARRIVEHCGLAWDPACIAFHKTRRPVRTASAAQVTKPLYNTSLARWRAYEAQLGPLIEALGDAAAP